MLQETLSPCISVLLLEDEPVTRKILSAVIEADPGLKLLAAFDSVRDGLAWLKTSAPDVLLLDLRLKDGLAIDVIQACSQHHPDCSIIVLTASDEGADVTACIEAGALGYLLKEDGLHDIGRAVRDIRLGGSPVSSSIIRKILIQSRHGDKVKVRVMNEDDIHFTEREISVLQLIARGLSYDEIAQTLSISVLTVQNYIKRLYRKLSVNSRGRAVFEAQRRGLLEPRS
jgi:DNA-binding NarL/FixJ family response regulator